MKKSLGYAFVIVEPTWVVHETPLYSSLYFYLCFTMSTVIAWLVVFVTDGVKSLKTCSPLMSSLCFRRTGTQQAQRILKKKCMNAPRHDWFPQNHLEKHVTPRGLDAACEGMCLSLLTLLGPLLQTNSGLIYRTRMSELCFTLQAEGLESRLVAPKMARLAQPIRST